MPLFEILATTGTGPQVTGVPPGRWLLAVSPVLVLLVLVLWGRWSTLVNALLTVAGAVAVGTLFFGADLVTVGVGLGKGAWVGVWILYVIGPALLMHHLATRMGMRDLGAALSSLLPTRSATVLLLAWVLPSFIQGVSGFGTPIAVAAPLLVAVGVAPVRAVALALVGYHWSVGFGSMGSSFYMGALTARLDGAGIAAFANSGAIVLGVNCLLAGVLVAVMYDGWRGVREGAWMLAIAGPTMAAVQLLVAQLEPGIASLCGGAAGIGAVLLVRLLPHPRSAALVATEAGQEASAAGDGTVPAGTHERVRARAADAAVPYVLLAVIALTVFLPPALRSWAKGHLLIGPSFPATGGGDGVRNQAVATYNPIAVLGHPGTFLLLACLASVLVWSARGRWEQGSWRPVLRGALKQTRKTAPSVVLLASLAGVLVDTGMVRTVAQGLAAAASSGYPVVAPLIGALGSFITGSTTSSNALFSPLQAEVAQLLGMRPADLLAGQLAGGNIGNSLAPVVILLGLSAVGAGKEVGRVLRMTLPPAAVLLASAVTVTWILVAVNGSARVPAAAPHSDSTSLSASERDGLRQRVDEGSGSVRGCPVSRPSVERPPGQSAAAWMRTQSGRWAGSRPHWATAPALREAMTGAVPNAATSTASSASMADPVATAPAAKPANIIVTGTQSGTVFAHHSEAAKSTMPSANIGTDQ